MSEPGTGDDHLDAIEAEIRAAERAVDLLRADPHRFGPGKVHLLRDDRTRCGKAREDCPGQLEQGPLERVDCKGCLTGVAADRRHERQAPRVGGKAAPMAGRAGRTGPGLVGPLRRLSLLLRVAGPPAARARTRRRALRRLPHPARHPCPPPRLPARHGRAALGARRRLRALPPALPPRQGPGRMTLVRARALCDHCGRPSAVATTGAGRGERVCFRCRRPWKSPSAGRVHPAGARRVPGQLRNRRATGAGCRRRLPNSSVCGRTGETVQMFTAREVGETLAVSTETVSALGPPRRAAGGQVAGRGGQLPRSGHRDVAGGARPPGGRQALDVTRREYLPEEGCYIVSEVGGQLTFVPAVAPLDTCAWIQCADCGRDGELYMVHDSVWPAT